MCLSGIVSLSISLVSWKYGQRHTQRMWADVCVCLNRSGSGELPIVQLQCFLLPARITIAVKTQSEVRCYMKPILNKFWPLFLLEEAWVARPLFLVPWNFCFKKSLQWIYFVVLVHGQPLWVGHKTQKPLRKRSINLTTKK